MTIFKIGLSPALLDGSGEPTFDRQYLDPLYNNDEMEVVFLPKDCAEIPDEAANLYDVLYLGAEPVRRSTAEVPDKRLKLVARHGVGFDSIDIDAMTENGVLVTNTPNAVRRPVATMAVTLILSLAQKLMIKHQITRDNRWHERTNHMGQGLTGKTLGIIGAGSIGCEILRMIAPFEMNCLAADPYASAETVAAAGGKLVPLDEMLARSDFVVVAALLTPETQHIVNAETLALMKKSAYLINVARGPLVKETDLIAALHADSIAGAALDVFEQEPVAPDNPLLQMENVIVTPHSLCWTDECFNMIARDGLTSIVDFHARRPPAFIVNPDVLTHPAMKTWFRGS